VTRLRWFTTSFAALLLVFVVACGGDSDDAASNNNTEGTGDASAAQPGAPGGGGSTTSSSLNLEQAASRLAELESYRFDISLSLDLDTPDDATGADIGAFIASLLGDVKAEGAYVGPDSYEVSVDVMDEPVQAVKIGDELWVNDGSGWETADLGFIGPLDFSSPGDLLTDLLPMAELAGAETSSENVNGVDTTRYSFDEQSLAALATALGAPIGFTDVEEITTLTLDVWLSADGLPVKLALDAAGESEGSKATLALDFNLTDLNDPGITIERPL
jgi:hypothetical protein